MRDARRVLVPLRWSSDIEGVNVSCPRASSMRVCSLHSFQQQNLGRTCAKRAALRTLPLQYRSLGEAGFRGVTVGWSATRTAGMVALLRDLERSRWWARCRQLPVADAKTMMTIRNIVTSRPGIGQERLTCGTSGKVAARWREFPRLRGHVP